MLSAATPPRQTQSVVQQGQCASVQKELFKENCPPSNVPAETPAKAPEQQSSCPAQTPVKISQGASRTANDKYCGFEVKNTFIHYGSPLKTVSVVTPPKTVPSNFAPEVLLLEQLPPRLWTPAAVMHSAATPSTAGGALAGREFYSSAPTVYLPAPAASATVPAASASTANSSTLLRLSDFLPSPSAAPAATGTASSSLASGLAVTYTQSLAPASSCGWHQTYVEAMPPVPPLPGNTQVPTTSSVVALAPAVSTLPPPPPPPPQLSAYDMASMQAAGVYGDHLQYATADASCASMLPPQMPPQQPPTLPLEAFQLCAQGGSTPMGAASTTSVASMFCMPPANAFTMNLGGSTPMAGMTGPACGSLGAFCMGSAMAGSSGIGPAPGSMPVSISAGHFPEPGSVQAPDAAPRLPETISLQMAWM